MISLTFSKTCDTTITLAYYQGGLITVHDEKGKSVKVTQKDLYEIFKNYLDNSESDC